ncbi:MAG TPA: OsmC family protein [Thermoanaerobaculia bacterium]|nr:OsmC family protein [Thermoanaerobaculia bacterium]HQR68557.1 OsmC family protein [Thermoanaerobaculia bacterium]
MSEEHSYRVASSWNPAEKQGHLHSGSGTLSIPFAGAPSLGGRADRTNPEELLLASLVACFVQTWAIFLAKLKIPLEAPVLDGRCELAKDPAGGFRVAKLLLVPRVPKALWEERRDDIEKTLELAEKYCIVSKVLRGSGLAIEVSPNVVPSAAG